MLSIDARHHSNSNIESYEVADRHLFDVAERHPARTKDEQRASQFQIGQIFPLPFGR